MREGVTPSSSNLRETPLIPPTVKLGTCALLPRPLVATVSSSERIVAEALELPGEGARIDRAGLPLEAELAGGRKDIGADRPVVAEEELLDEPDAADARDAAHAEGQGDGLAGGCGLRGGGEEDHKKEREPAHRRPVTPPWAARQRRVRVDALAKSGTGL